MRQLIDRFRADSSGATALEYSLIGAFISVAIIAGAVLIGPAVAQLLTDAAGSF